MVSENDFHQFNNETPIIANTNMAQQLVIIDKPGKSGKEVQDTTIAVNSELKLYAAIFNNGKYKSEAYVDWFWADTSQISNNPHDTTFYLGSGSSIIFKSSQADTGFIFVKELPNAPGDSTGLIRIIYGERLAFGPIQSSDSLITRGQKNILVSYSVENIGNFTSIIQEANLVISNRNSQNVTNQYQINRIDTTTLIPIGVTKKFEFLVDVKVDADIGLCFIDAALMSRDSFYTNIEAKHRWQVQTPPQLNIDRIAAQIEVVFPGQDDIYVAMHVSNRGSASVHNINADLTFWRNGQEVTGEYEYKLAETNPQIIKGDSSARIDFIVNVKPSATLGTIVINGKISATDINSGSSYSDEGADLPASWLVTFTSAQVGIISTRIKCPNRTNDGNGEVNVNQNFSIEVAVKNLGTVAVENIGVTLVSDGNSIFRSDTSQSIASLFTNQIDTVKYELVANAESIPFIENFSTRIDSASTVSGGTANISAAVDSIASLKITYPAELSLHLDTNYMQVALNQIFNIVGSIWNLPERAGYDSTGILSIQLPEGYVLLSGNNSQRFKENESVIWEVRSPSSPGGPDSILVYVSHIPRDKNDPTKYAVITVDSAILVVERLAAFVEITDVTVIDPVGATDDTVSTEQGFSVCAKFNYQKVENIFAKLFESSAFSILDNQIKYLDGDSVTWNLKASQFSDGIPDKIIIQAWGTVENDTTKIYSSPDSSLEIQTVSKANLKVTAQIISPPSALQGRISPGLIFQIKGEIINLGDADFYRNCTLLIDVQDRSSFSVISDTVMSVENGSAIWTIQASNNMDITPKIIKIKIHEIPFDENSNQQVFVDSENRITDIQVFTGVAVAQLMIRKLPEIAPKAIAPGITEIMMGIEFSNLMNDAGFLIRIDALKFDIENKQNDLITPSSVISGFRIINDEFIIGEMAEFLQNPIEVPLDYPITLDAQENQRIFIEVDCRENLSQQFQINMKDTSYFSIGSLLDVLTVDELKNPTIIFNLRSHCPIIIENDLMQSFFNYPNPFGNSERKQTRFVYYLRQDSDIQLEIYTLIGELVWHRSYSKYEPQGKKGLHKENEIIWDGKNSKGNKVLNGVYIAKIKTSQGESAMTKVAVIK